MIKNSKENQVLSDEVANEILEAVDRVLKKLPALDKKLLSWRVMMNRWKMIATKNDPVCEKEALKNCKWVQKEFLDPLNGIVGKWVKDQGGDCKNKYSGNPFKLLLVRFPYQMERSAPLLEITQKILEAVDQIAFASEEKIRGCHQGKRVIRRYKGEESPRIVAYGHLKGIKDQLEEYTKGKSSKIGPNKKVILLKKGDQKNNELSI